MDTITHGIAGALIGKAVFGGENLFTLRPASRARILTAAAVLGAVFPDADTIRDFASRDDLLVLTWHRSLTHSLLLLPAFALAMAGLVRWFARQRQWECPSFYMLTTVFAVGIGSHILLDLATNFGTMIWSPLSRTRPAWDLIFIVDFTLSAMFLLPQFLAGVYESPAHFTRRAQRGLLLCLLATIVIVGISRAAGAPISTLAALLIVVFLICLFLVPRLKSLGFQLSRGGWCRAGLACSIAYICAAVFAHHAAAERVQRFAASQNLEVQSLAALPLPPSFWHWDGLIRSPRGVYRLDIDLAEPDGETARSQVLEYRFYPDAPLNPQIQQAKSLPEVQTLLWFARFPVTRFRKEGRDVVVEFVDLRFRPILPGRTFPFTYIIRMDEMGRILSKGWARR